MLRASVCLAAVLTALQGISACTENAAQRDDPDRAVQAVFGAACRTGDPSDFARFLARYPAHPLSEDARLALFRKLDDGAPGSRSSNDPDAGIYEAFSNVLASGSDERRDLFLERYAAHPLSSELREHWSPDGRLKQTLVPGRPDPCLRM